MFVIHYRDYLLLLQLRRIRSNAEVRLPNVTQPPTARGGERVNGCAPTFFLSHSKL